MEKDTLLLRQVHPSFVQFDGISTQAFSVPVSVTSQTFKPTPKDENKLSVYDGDKFTAQQSYDHYTENLSSYGVLGVTVSEFQSEGLESKSDDETFPGHVYVDYSALTKGEVEKKAKKLRDIAWQRSWLYPETKKEADQAS